MRSTVDLTCRKCGLRTTDAAHRTANMAARGTNLVMTAVTSNGRHRSKKDVQQLPRSNADGAVNSGKPQPPQFVHQTQSQGC